MSAGTGQRKLAAILFTDMVCNSALSQRNEAPALELFEEHRGVLRGFFPMFAGCRGEVFPGGGGAGGVKRR